ncbi:unannotated protein [freshwater metagenome]|uniref:Unannotated protein n=1 Tax=freshwater metagenome TaxID=449393 RepID=A0A6J7KVN4_9ZZZZ
MTDFTWISVGCVVLASAASSTVRSWSRSLTSVTRRVCQPYAWYRISTSSVNESDVAPSSEMSLSS